MRGVDKTVRTLLLQPEHGLAGDMFLGLLVDLGASLADIQRDLRSLDISGWAIHSSQVLRNEMAATRVHVQCDPTDTVRHLSDILKLIRTSALSEGAKRRACDTFQILGQAEAEVHGIDIEAVHFHEVGAVDAIIDICGSCIALEALDIQQLVCGALPGGSGAVHCAHGTLAVPVPAVVALCQSGFELQLNQGEGEMVTPTGMALLAANGLPLPESLNFHPSQMGFGAGTRESSALRGTLGRAPQLGTEMIDEVDLSADSVTMLRTNIDDVPGERLSFVMQQLMDAGALDVTLTPCLMKKGRPAHRLEVMVGGQSIQEMVRHMMRHTGSLGVRIQPMARLVASREVVIAQTAFGPISVKVGPYGVKPEYEQCAVAARTHQVPLHRVQQAAREAAIYVIDGEGENDCRK